MSVMFLRRKHQLLKSCEHVLSSQYLTVTVCTSVNVTGCASLCVYDVISPISASCNHWQPTVSHILTSR